MGPRPAALTPKTLERRGARKPRLLRRDAEHKPVRVEALAMGLPATDYRIINWRAERRDEESLLIEWPEGQNEPKKCLLSTRPVDATLERLVAVTKMRWRIERDYQDLTQRHVPNSISTLR